MVTSTWVVAGGLGLGLTSLRLRSGYDLDRDCLDLDLDHLDPDLDPCERPLGVRVPLGLGGRVGLGSYEAAQRRDGRTAPQGVCSAGTSHPIPVVEHTSH